MVEHCEIRENVMLLNLGVFTLILGVLFGANFAEAKSAMVPIFRPCLKHCFYRWLHLCVVQVAPPVAVTGLLVKPTHLVELVQGSPSPKEGRYGNPPEKLPEGDENVANPIKRANNRNFQKVFSA